MLAGLAAAPVAVPAAAPARAAAPVKILIIGDSMTQGSAGDWSWRYRLAKHLTDHGASFDLVGHRDDLYDNVAGVWGSHAYVDPVFDQVHSARWGMKLADLEVPIGTLVSTYHPDVVLAMLGDNDLSAGTTPTQVGALLEDLVDDARASQPGVAVVLGHDPRPHTQPNSPALNAEIDARAAALDTPSARVVVANTDAGYDDLQDTWDGAHPNARGELKIAAAFENALHQVDAAFPAAGPIPTVPLGPRIPPVLSATAGVGTVQLSWIRSPGSQKSDVYARDVTAGGPFQKVASDQTGTAYTVAGLTAQHQVQLQTRPYKGFWLAEPDAWSNVVAVTVLDTLTPPVVVQVPALAPVQGVRVHRSRHGIRTSAEAVTGATSYTLRIATTARCGRVPAAARFNVVASGLGHPSTKVRLRARAVWVRWVAVRDGVEGELASSSTVCRRLTR